MLESEVRYILSERLESLLMGCNSADRAREYFTALLNIGITEEQIEETFVIKNRMDYSMFPSFDFKIKMLEYISEKWNELPNENNSGSSIPDIKRKIKHSKNPMEKKMLEKQLNVLFKKRKKR